MSNIVPINQEAQSAAAVSGTLTIRNMDDLSRMSGMLAKSGFFSDCKEAAQAGVKILAGLELGFPAFSAMSGIHIIQGKPAIGANLMAAAVRRSTKYDYEEFEHSDKACRIAFYEAEFKPEIRALKRALLKGEIDKSVYEERVSMIALGISEFTADDAKRVGTKNMDKFPKNMLFARAISNGVRWFCADIFLGAPVYTPEELGATTDDEGNVIDITPTPQKVEAKVLGNEPAIATPKLASEAQVKKIWAVAKKAGWREGDGEILKALLADYGCFNEEGQPSVKAIPADRVTNILNALETPEEWTKYTQKVESPIQAVEAVVEASRAESEDEKF